MGFARTLIWVFTITQAETERCTPESSWSVAFQTQSKRRDETLRCGSTILIWKYFNPYYHVVDYTGEVRHCL